MRVTLKVCRAWRTDHASHSANVTMRALSDPPQPPLWGVNIAGSDSQIYAPFFIGYWLNSVVRVENA